VFWRRHLGLLCSPSQASQLLHGGCSFQGDGWPLDMGVAQLTEAGAYPDRCKVAIPWRANRAALRGYGAPQRIHKQKRPTFR